MSDRVRLIGIAGPSASGKSAVAVRLRQRRPDDVVLVSIDDFYRDRSSELASGHVDFDQPGAIESDLLVRCARTLARGAAVEIPRYDFETHTREPEPRLVEPAPFVVIEGLFALWWTELRELYQTTVYVDTPDAVCLQRRVARDTAERGRTPASVVEQMRDTVLPAGARYVRPTRRHAEVILDGQDHVDRSVDLILERLESEETVPW